MSTEDALRDALDQAQQVEKLVEAMRSPDKSQVSRGPGRLTRRPATGGTVLGKRGPVLRESRPKGYVA